LSRPRRACSRCRKKSSELVQRSTKRSSGSTTIAPSEGTHEDTRFLQARRRYNVKVRVKADGSGVDVANVKMSIWAKRHRRAVKGALLATPPDFESPLPDGYPSIETLQRNGWTPTPGAPLPFPTIVAASTNDPLGRFERVTDLAACWGSRVVNLGAVGHLNPASGFGECPRAQEMLRELD
jgi:hypothetical protein